MYLILGQEYEFAYIVVSSVKNVEYYNSYLFIEVVIQFLKFKSLKTLKNTKGFKIS